MLFVSGGGGGQIGFVVVSLSFQICNFYEIRKISEDLVKPRKFFIKIGKKNDDFQLKKAKFASSGEKK